MNITPEQNSRFPYAELREAALYWLVVSEADVKAKGVKALSAAWRGKELELDANKVLTAAASIPGRPQHPELVPPLAVQRRSMRTVEGRAAMIHALAHIEFNAVNLALDAVWRFVGMPDDYYADWLRVAEEEALHFTLLSEHLRTLGFQYGDFAAHNSLWDMAEKTKDDVLARMALVPRTLEARGLDASPPVRAKLAQAGDTTAAEILDIILREEIGHVAIGNRWYAWACEARGVDPVNIYAQLTAEYKAPQLRGPFNFEARRAAGFSEAELVALGKT